METIVTLEPGQFLLSIPEIGISEVYCGYPYAVQEALDYSAVGYAARIWNYKNDLVFGK